MPSPSVKSINRPAGTSRRVEATACAETTVPTMLGP